MEDQIEVRHGDIFNVDFGPANGGIRLAMIVQNNVGNKNSPTVIVFPIFSKDENEISDYCVQLGNSKNYVQCNRPMTIDKKQILKDKLGKISSISPEMKRIDKAKEKSMPVGDYKNNHSTNHRIKRGGIYYVDLPEDNKGSVQGGTRPCIVLQNDKDNEEGSSIIVACLTSQFKNELKTHVPLRKADYPNFEYDSIIMCEQIMTVDKESIKLKLCQIHPQDWNLVDFAKEISIPTGGAVSKNQSWNQGPISNGRKLIRDFNDYSDIPMDFELEDCRHFPPEIKDLINKKSLQNWGQVQIKRMNQQISMEDLEIIGNCITATIEDNQKGELIMPQGEINYRNEIEERVKKICSKKRCPEYVQAEHLERAISAFEAYVNDGLSEEDAYEYFISLGENHINEMHKYKRKKVAIIQEPSSVVEKTNSSGTESVQTIIDEEPWKEKDWTLNLGDYYDDENIEIINAMSAGGLSQRKIAAKTVPPQNQTQIQKILSGRQTKLKASKKPEEESSLNRSSGDEINQEATKLTTPDFGYTGGDFEIDWGRIVGGTNTYAEAKKMLVEMLYNFGLSTCLTDNQARNFEAQVGKLFEKVNGKEAWELELDKEKQWQIKQSIMTTIEEKSGISYGQ